MLLEATSELASHITGAIRDAARTTGAGFEYLLKTAQRESAFNPAAKSPSSSATGLFQFIDQTWLGTLKNAGSDLGYGRYADGIVRTDTGRYVVPDPAKRQEIMKLRTDPAASSAMAGAFTQRNAAFLKQRLGRAPTDGELYIAHFLGPTGAVQLISAAEQSPQASAAKLFPTAARANRSIFYAKGAPRSTEQVYAALVAKHQNTRTPAPAVTPTMVAEASGTKVGRTASTPAAATVAAVEPPQPTVQAYAPERGPVFHNLFRTERNAPVSSVVTELWTAKGARSPVTTGGTAPPPPPVAAPEPSQRPAGRPLELFRFLRPDIRASGSRQA